MKVGGVKYDRSKALTEPYVIRQGNNQDGSPRLLAFIGQPVWDMEDFRKRCPIPTIPDSCVRFKPGGKKEPDPNAREYIALLEEHDRRAWGYVILKSLEPSNIEFDNLSLADPETWGNAEDELKRELGHYEFARVMKLVDIANNIDNDKLEENRQTFFLQNSPASTDSTSADEAGSSESQQPVNAGA